MRDVCLGIEARHQLKFLEIGTDRDHVHFLVPSVPTYSVNKLGAGGSINTGAARKLQERQADHRLPALLDPLGLGGFDLRLLPLADEAALHLGHHA